MAELEQELRHTRVPHERRRARRYRVDLPVEFEGGTGVTRNVSQTGVLFATDREAKVGDLVDFSLILGEHDAGWKCRIACIACVVRVAHLGRGWLVAADIQAYRSVQI
jgi:PilZ domain